VTSNGGERIDGGERQWSRINGGCGLCKIFCDNRGGNNSGKIQEI